MTNHFKKMKSKNKNKSKNMKNKNKSKNMKNKNKSKKMKNKSKKMKNKNKSKKMKSKNKSKKMKSKKKQKDNRELQKQIVEEEKEDEEEENNIINDFTKKNIFSTIFSGSSIIKYKIGIYWIPLIIYITLIYIYTLLNINIFHETNPTMKEFIIGIIAGLLMFIIYTITDLIYQHVLCKKKHFGKFLLNSLSNSFIPALFVFLGFSLGLLLQDSRITTLISAKQDGKVNNQEMEQLTKSATKNLQLNNIFISIIFYVFAIIYRNPINKPDCISNKLCLKKKHKFKKNKQM